MLQLWVSMGTVLCVGNGAVGSWWKSHAAVAGVVVLNR